MILLSFFVIKELDRLGVTPPSLNKLADAVGADAKNNSWEIKETLEIDSIADGFFT